MMKHNDKKKGRCGGGPLNDKQTISGGFCLPLSVPESESSVNPYDNLSQVDTYRHYTTQPRHFTELIDQARARIARHEQAAAYHTQLAQKHRAILFALEVGR